MSAPAQNEEQVAKDRRASRKAAAACLARQRHKAFVSNLQDSTHHVRYRVEALRARRGHAEAVAANLMIERLTQGLPKDKAAQLTSWLRNSAAASMAAAAPPPPPLPPQILQERAQAVQQQQQQQQQQPQQQASSQAPSSQPQPGQAGTGAPPSSSSQPPLPPSPAASRPGGAVNPSGGSSAALANGGAAAAARPAAPGGGAGAPLLSPPPRGLPSAPPSSTHATNGTGTGHGASGGAAAAAISGPVSAAAREAADAELSRQLFLDQQRALLESGQQQAAGSHGGEGGMERGGGGHPSHLPPPDSDYDHYDTPLGLLPQGSSSSMATLHSSHSSMSLAEQTPPQQPRRSGIKRTYSDVSAFPPPPLPTPTPSHHLRPRFSRSLSLPDRCFPPFAAAHSTQVSDRAGLGTAHVSISRRGSLEVVGGKGPGSGGGNGNGGGGGNGNEMSDEEEDEEGQPYGEGLAVLLSHLASSRRPQVQAWLQLKEDLVKSDAAALHATQVRVQEPAQPAAASKQEPLPSHSQAATLPPPLSPLACYPHLPY